MAVTTRLFGLIIAALLLAAAADAQTVARVVRAQSTIYNPGFTTVAAVVPAGTELTVIGREGMWYRVLLPNPETQRQFGFIAISQVEIVSGTPPSAAPSRGAPATSPQPQRPRPATAPQGRTASTPAGAGGLRGFGQVGYGWPSA